MMDKFNLNDDKDFSKSIQIKELININKIGY